MTQLEHRNREVQQFVNAVSHDLAAPVRGVGGLASLLQEHLGESLDAESKKLIVLINEAVQGMQRMVEDLLAYARLDCQPKLSPGVNCADVLRQAMANLHTVIREVHAEVTADPLPTLTANASQLIRLFQNLIGNAIKFRRPDPPRIHISATETAEGWQFSLQDNGIGIDPRNFEHIFVVFRRLHSAEKFPGTGIGLAACKVIVERHGGSIWVESNLGKGSVFHFTIPHQPHAADRPLK